jgi:hypothetical protein
MLRPTGIIRTLPSLYGNASVGAKRFQRSIALLESGKIPSIGIALQCIPRHEVLHMYLLVEGEIRVRLNIADYQPGDARECWDRSIRKPKYWAICTGPVSKPPESMPWKGFQGIRYTEDLW